MSHQDSVPKKYKLFTLTLAALGVVYGDIGTSPLYAVNQIFFGKGGATINTENILGCISLIIYFLTIVVAFKYVVFVLRANNEGEGGVLALYAILSNYKDRLNKWIIPFALMFLMLAAGLLFGDGLITPAISVLSAVEGLSLVAPSLHTYIIPITLILLFLLFFFQHKGTSKVGKAFGPIIVVWFFVIALLGLHQILISPSILRSLNPYYLFYFIGHASISHLLIIIGFAMLAITGGEALYADMGHFGKSPIQIGWFSMVYPALILNYLGQGAYLLSGAKIYNEDIFYSLVPHNLLLPVVILATCSTVIASQALISGAFSLTSQASVLGIMPVVRKFYTDEQQEGQIYIPFINWSLCAGCLLLVVVFETSNNLASAYGLAVAGVMLATSLAMILVARLHWRWQWWKALVLFVPLALIDVGFFVSNSVKFLQGGFIPFGVGFCIWSLMNTWQWGRDAVTKKYNDLRTLEIKKILTIDKGSFTLLKKTILFMTKDFVENEDDMVPTAFQIFWNRFTVLPQNLIFLHVSIEKVPHMKNERFTVKKFTTTNGVTVTSVKINFGYWEEPKVEKFLREMNDQHALNIPDDHREWLFYIIQERLVNAGQSRTLWSDMRFKAFSFLSRNADTADHYFELGKDVGLSTETLSVYL